MSDEISNVQVPPATPPAIPPSSAGTNADELAARIAELEKAREGLIRDVQHERSKRQELEQRLAITPAPSPVNQDVSNDELGKVLNPYIAPVVKAAEEARKQAAQLQAAYEQDRALSYLASKTGKKVDDIKNDSAFIDRVRGVVKKWGLVGSDYELAVKAMDLMELEDMKAKEAERVRAAQVAQNSSLPAGNPPAPANKGREYSADEFNRMSPAEFDKLSQSGDFRKVDGKFVYSPR